MNKARQPVGETAHSVASANDSRSHARLSKLQPTQEEPHADTCPACTYCGFFHPDRDPCVCTLRRATHYEAVPEAPIYEPPVAFVEEDWDDEDAIPATPTEGPETEYNPPWSDDDEIMQSDSDEDMLSMGPPTSPPPPPEPTPTLTNARETASAE